MHSRHGPKDWREWISSLIFYLRDFPIFFFFNDTATTEIYTLSLHDALPICAELQRPVVADGVDQFVGKLLAGDVRHVVDRKSTRLNSSHVRISYAVFCLKKKKCEYASMS